MPPPDPLSQSTRVEEFASRYVRPAPFGWSDRISSVKHVGAVTALCEHSWYRGEKLWLTRVMEIPNLVDHGFNDRASSLL